MNYEHKIKVNIHGKKIHITPECGPDAVASVLATKIIDTEDKAIRESLKRLGWMSPEDVAMVRPGFENLYEQVHGKDKHHIPFRTHMAVDKFNEYDLIQSRNKSRERKARHDDMQDALVYSARYFPADGIFNRGKSRYSNMSLTELLTEAEAAARQGATGPLYAEALERLRQVAETMERINESR